MLAGTVAALAHHAAGVGVVHHQARAVALADLYYLRQGAEVAFH